MLNAKGAGAGPAPSRAGPFEGQELAQLSKQSGTNPNQEIKQFQTGQQQALAEFAAERDHLKKVPLDAKGHELVQLQAATQAHEQELATIKDTIGWKALNKYRETRERSAVFRYLHFLFTEPVKRGFKKKIDIPYEATSLASPNEISPSDRPEPSIFVRPGAEGAGFVRGTGKRLRDMYLHARDYPSWRERRLTERLDESAQLVGLRNNLISVIVYAIDAGKASPRLDATLRSLLQQTYRNIEVLVVGRHWQCPPSRGLFQLPGPVFRTSTLTS